VTVKRDLKRIIRARMARTGEPFATARSHVLRARREQQGGDAAAQTGAPGSAPAAAEPRPRSREGARLEAAVIRRGTRTARVRVLATGEQITVRARDLWHVMPGHVVTLALQRRWRHRGQLYAEGEVSEVRIDVPALGLLPLRVEERGAFIAESATEAADVADLADMAEALQELRARLTATPRVAYEMEQVLPGTAAGSGFDPILAAVDRKRRGDVAGAVRLLMDLLTEDLRCLDAHAHLGNLVFPSYPEHALIHYEIGAAIGEHALGPTFAGALPWSLLDNRPFLRCLHGQGLALWRLERMEEAARVFERLLWLNPADGQGAGRCWAEVQAGRPWQEDEGTPA